MSPRRAAMRLLAPALLLTALCAAASTGAQTQNLKQGSGTDEIVFVGSNWDGTVSMLDPTQDFAEVGRVNAVPDQEERELEIALNPVDLVFFLLIRQQIGEGNDQLVDDMYTTPDGSLLIASRPSYRDVVALDLANCEDLSNCDIVWRFQVEGQRSDHMAISPDGLRGGGLGLHGQRRAHPGHRDRRGARPVPLRRFPAREHLLGGRGAPVPREHRPRLRAPSGRQRPPHQHAEGRTRLPGGGHRELRRGGDIDLGKALVDAGHRKSQSRRASDGDHPQRVGAPTSRSRSFTGSLGLELQEGSNHQEDQPAPTSSRTCRRSSTS